MDPFLMNLLDEITRRRSAFIQPANLSGLGGGFGPSLGGYLPQDQGGGGIRFPPPPPPGDYVLGFKDLQRTGAQPDPDDPMAQFYQRLGMLGGITGLTSPGPNPGITPGMGSYAAAPPMAKMGTPGTGVDLASARGGRI